VSVSPFDMATLQSSTYCILKGKKTAIVALMKARLIYPIPRRNNPCKSYLVLTYQLDD